MSSGKAGLHIHSDMSFLDGRARPEEIAAQAKACGDEAVACTDHDEVGSHPSFFKACEAAGIKPVAGTEARWLYNVAQSREDKTRGKDASHICLLAANDTGLRNMWILSSLAYEKENFYAKPNLTPELMREYGQGMYASDGCGLTRFADYAAQGDIGRCRQEWGVLLDIFGDRFYSELHTFQIIDPQTDKDRELNAKITAMNQVKAQLAKEMGVPLVVVNDAHYAQQNQWQEHRLVWQMNTSNKNDQADSQGQAADWMMTTTEMVEWMSRHGIPSSVTREAMTNSGDIAAACNVTIKPNLSMPRLHATDTEDVEAFLAACEEGFKRHVVDKGLPFDAYADRLEREMALIVDKGMAGYFNVVADYVMAARDGSYRRWVEPGARKSPCLCGPGRGSAGGSLVTYVLGITSLDPIKYDLMFERFINPDRPDFPDIDVDFQKSHKDGVKAYLGKRYGTGNVCSIGTRSRSGPKQMLTDLAKAMGIEWSEIKKMTKVVGEVDRIEPSDDPEDLVDEDGNPIEPPSWDEVLAEKGQELAPYARDHPLLFKRLEKMIGLSRQSGVHAAGVIVNTEALLGNVPTRRKPGGTGTLATQFDMHEIEALGGVKDDLLANKGLDVLAIARELIYQRHGVWLDYDGFGFGTPPDAKQVIVFGDEQYNDSAIWEQIDRGQTAGIFQIHTAGGTKQAMRFRPRNLTDVADLASINRPGVTRVPGLLDTYIRRRHGEEDVVYDHPMMEAITGPTSSMYTYGILVYQEQLIRTARDLAGFTAGQAEGLRKAIGKKLADKIAEIKPLFIAGCLANPDFVNQRGTEKIAMKIWASLEAAGAYAFNKSHATGYAMQPCWEIWTKHYYFDEFITGCLAVHTDKTNRFIREARRRNRPILGPCVNGSGAHFTLSEDGIRYGLTNIHGIGDSSADDVTAKAPFTSLADYLQRVHGSKGGKKGVVENLVKIGAFDFTGRDREDLLADVYHHRAATEERKGAPVRWEKADAAKRQALVSARLAKTPEAYPRVRFDEVTVFAIEEELVGTFITHDPMARYAPMIEAECISHPLDMDDYATSDPFTIGGELIRLTPYKQKDGRMMAFLTVRWLDEDFEILAFADAYARNKPMLKLNAPVACAVIKLKNGGCQLSKVERLDLI